MKAFLIDPLKARDQVVTQVDIDEAEIRSLLGIGADGAVEIITVGPASWNLELVVADPMYFQEVRRLGEFRIEKSSGDYRSVAGRGVILGHEGEASQLQGLLSSFGIWVSA